MRKSRYRHKVQVIYNSIHTQPGISMTVMEAMALGFPIVQSPTGLVGVTNMSGANGSRAALGGG